MKILILDIETAPNKVYSWGLFKQNIALNQIDEPGYTLSWAAKWFGEKKMMFSSLFADGKHYMIRDIHALLDEADIVIHYNGSRFDIPTLNQEFILEGLKPPAPVQEIDLLKTARQKFRLLSNKLEYIVQHLGIGEKYKHEGMSLWTKCMDGDEEAWATMQKYNEHDVLLLEKLYPIFLPWIKNHPNTALFRTDAKMVCPNCESQNLHKRGHAHTKTMLYQRYQCQSCGTWSRERLTSLEADKRASVLVGL